MAILQVSKEGRQPITFGALENAYITVFDQPPREVRCIRDCHIPAGSTANRK